MRLVTLYNEDADEESASTDVQGCLTRSCIGYQICVKEELGSSWVRRRRGQHSDFGFTLLARSWSRTRPLALAWPVLSQLLRPDGQALGAAGALQLLVDRSHLVVLHTVGAHCLPEKAGVELAPSVAEPDVVLRADAGLPRQQSRDVNVLQVEEWRVEAGLVESCKGLSGHQVGRP